LIYKYITAKIIYNWGLVPSFLAYLGLLLCDHSFLAEGRLISYILIGEDKLSENPEIPFVVYDTDRFGISISKEVYFLGGNDKKFSRFSFCTDIYQFINSIMF
jgi:hypothetical protein